MIDLTIPQAFVSDFSNVFELIIIYRLVTNYLSKKIILIDFLASLVIVCVPILESSLDFPLIIIYLWLFDRKYDRPQILYDNIIAMCTIIVMASLIDLCDHYMYKIFLEGKDNISLVGWILPITDLTLTIIVGILVIFFVAPKIREVSMQILNPTPLWKFVLYFILNVVAEKEGIANDYAPLFLLISLTIILIGGSSLFSIIRSSIQIQNQQRLIDTYKLQIASAHEVNKQYDQIRRERHDTRNMLLSIQGYIRDHKDKEAAELLSTFLQNDIAEKHYNEIDLALDKIKISGLHNLIKEKAYKIVEKGIPFSFEVNAEIDELPGSEIKTARIIGILMDNAIEATFKQAKPYIQFALLKHSPEVYELVIANSIEQKLNINTALKFEHSTKKGHQGIGLSNVTQLVENDDHYSFSAEVKDKVIIMTCFIQGK